MADKLHPVSQSFDADASGYLRAMSEMIGRNIAFGLSVDEDVLAKIGQISGALRGLPDSKTIRVSVDPGQALADIARIDAALGSLGDREVTVRVRYEGAGDVPAGLGAAAGIGAAATPAAMIRELRDISASMDEATFLPGPDGRPHGRPAAGCRGFRCRPGGADAGAAG